MSLPAAYANAEDYFEACLLFLKRYENLYNFANTEILNEGILDILPEDIEVEAFNEDFDLKLINNEYIKDFLADVENLVVSHDFDGNDLEVKFDAPLSVKKKHEIIYLAREIGKVCEENDCDTVVDLGSGLGYLDQHLYDETNYNILGIECNNSHYVGAKTRQRKYHSDSLERVKYIKYTVTEESCSNLERYLEEKFENSRHFCITGLHACADLTVDAINLFLLMNKAKCLIIMPCCYHKIVAGGKRFKNFPLSKNFKVIHDKHEGHALMTVPFLRLAAQPPSATDILEDMVFNLLARGVLQVYANRHNCKLKRNKRKPVRTKTLENNFENYVKDAETGFTLVSNEDVEGIEFKTEELREIWEETKCKRNKAAIFILLQRQMQPVFENLILYDRLVFLRENGVSRSDYKKIFNERISPRCLALLAFK